MCGGETSGSVNVAGRSTRKITVMLRRFETGRLREVYVCEECVSLNEVLLEKMENLVIKTAVRVLCITCSKFGKFLLKD